MKWCHRCNITTQRMAERVNLCTHCFFFFFLLLSVSHVSCCVWPVNKNRWAPHGSMNIQITQHPMVDAGLAGQPAAGVSISSRRQQHKELLEDTGPPAAASCHRIYSSLCRQIGGMKTSAQAQACVQLRVKLLNSVATKQQLSSDKPADGRTS